MFLWLSTAKSRKGHQPGVRCHRTFVHTGDSTNGHNRTFAARRATKFRLDISSWLWSAEYSEHLMSTIHLTADRPVNTPRQVLFASLIGTTIEFFDFYIYATAAVLVFPRLFFPASDPASARLASVATFAIAFVARPIGSAIFGHFGDRIGRKTT